VQVVSEFEEFLQSLCSKLKKLRKWLWRKDIPS